MTKNDSNNNNNYNNNNNKKKKMMMMMMMNLKIESCVLKEFTERDISRKLLNSNNTRNM